MDALCGLQLFFLLFGFSFFVSVLISLEFGIYKQSVPLSVHVNIPVDTLLAMVYYCWCCVVTWVMWSPHIFFFFFFSYSDLLNYNWKVTKRDLFQLLLSLTLSCLRLFFMCWWAEPQANVNVDILVFPLTACTFTYTKELVFDWLFLAKLCFFVFSNPQDTIEPQAGKNQIFFFEL